MDQAIGEGILLPLLTPFDTRGEVDEAVLTEMAEFMVRSRVHGLFLLGSAGQGPAMTIAQRKRAAEAVLRQVQGRIPVVIHAGCADTESTVELALHAQACGAPAVAVVTPYYYSDHSDFEILEHFRAVAAALGETYPLFLYDNSHYTGIHLGPERVRRYRDALPSLCGMKASYVGVEELLRYVRVVSPPFRVFSGSVFNLLATAPLGVKGAIHPPTSLFPELCVELWEAVQRQNWREAFEAQGRLFEIMEVLHGVGNKARAAQAAIARLRGFAVQRYPRWKTEGLSSQEIGTLEKALEKAGIALKAV